jgi:hypothetical protein
LKHVPDLGDQRAAANRPMSMMIRRWRLPRLRAG